MLSIGIAVFFGRDQSKRDVNKGSIGISPMHSRVISSGSKNTRQSPGFGLFIPPSPMMPATPSSSSSSITFNIHLIPSHLIHILSLLAAIAKCMAY